MTIEPLLSFIEARKKTTIITIEAWLLQDIYKTHWHYALKYCNFNSLYFTLSFQLHYFPINLFSKMITKIKLLPLNLVSCHLTVLKIIFRIFPFMYWKVTHYRERKQGSRLRRDRFLGCGCHFYLVYKLVLCLHKAVNLLF